MIYPRCRRSGIPVVGQATADLAYNAPETRSSQNRLVHVLLQASLAYLASIYETTGDASVDELLKLYYRRVTY